MKDQQHFMCVAYIYIMNEHTAEIEYFFYDPGNI